MDVKLSIQRTVELPGSDETTAQALFDDVETTLRYFPKLALLRALGNGCFQWRMKTIGSRMARVSYNAELRVQTSVDADSHRLAWTPVPGHGNTDLAGEITVVPAVQGSTLGLKVVGKLRDVPVPLLYRPMAAPFIQGKFLSLADGFLDNARVALTGHAAPVEQESLS